MKWTNGLKVALVTLPLIVACATGSDDVRIGGSGGPGAKICEAETTKACTCGTAAGTQRCLPAGDAFGDCECGGAAQQTADAAPPGPTCNLAPACTDAVLNPRSNLPKAANLAATLRQVTAEERVERLRGRIVAGDPSVRVLAAALAPAELGEDRTIGVVRSTLEGNSVARARVINAFQRAGMGSPQEYRAAHRVVVLNGPTSPSEDAGAPVGDGGAAADAAACGKPKLRMRVASLTVHEDSERRGDEVYCVVTAEGKDAEVKVTKITPSLEKGQTYSYSLAEGVVWGQEGMKETATNLLLKYECIENDEPSQWNKIVSDLAAELTSRGAKAAAGAVGGWVVPIVEGIASVIGNILGIGGGGDDERLFEATQTIDYQAQVALSNGAYWTVRRSNGDFDWELRMEVWGCTENGNLQR